MDPSQGHRNLSGAAMKVHVEVGIMEQGQIRNPLFVMTGDTHAVSRALIKLGYEFQYLDDDGNAILREDRTGYRARYTQVQDHNPKEDHHS